MSPLVARPARLPSAVRRERKRAASDSVALEPRYREPVVIFAIAYAVYAAVGLYTTLDLDIVVGDAKSRLFHAYYVWHNDPGKLTAIGFYWPPVQTLVLLPFGIVRSLSQSFAALPLMSAGFGAALVLTVERTLVLSGIGRATRWALVAGFALNPMIAFYAGNGMAELVYLLPLTLGLSVFLRWSIAPRWHHLLLIGLCFGVGLVTRYELGAWLVLLAVGSTAILMRQRASLAAIEAALVSVIVPSLYALTLWTYITYSITGDAFGWLTVLVPEAPGQAVQFDPVPRLEGLWEIVMAHAGLFAPTFAVLTLLVVRAAWLKSVTGAVLAAAIGLSVLVQAAIVLRSGNAFYLELRYNMRALPITMIGLGWLLGTVPPGPRLRLASVLAVTAVAAAIPVAGATMMSADRGQERAFVRGILFGEPSPSTGPVLADERQLADEIRRIDPADGSVLTDDAVTFGVMLRDGDLNRYFDRIDRGDVEWRAARDAVFARHRPVGDVRYLLVARDPTLPDDLAAVMPSLRDPAMRASYLRVAAANDSYVLYRITGSRP